MPVFRLGKSLAFPPPEIAEADGLLAVGGDLKEERILLAYRNGIFPWFGEEEPVCWWSPDPRCVISPESFRFGKTLKRTIKKGVFEIALDRDFGGVIRSCARIPRRDSGGTWIVETMIEAYERLHESGFAHSVEAYRGGELAGGLYGVKINGCFFGESMFHRDAEASKAALAFLVARAYAEGWALIDCQFMNPFLCQMGAYELERSEFLGVLRAGVSDASFEGDWKIDDPHTVTNAFLTFKSSRTPLHVPTFRSA